MAAWTTPDHVIESWIGEDVPTDAALIEKWIAKAEREVRFRIPGILDRITAEEVDLLDNVRDVVSAMVSRKLNNPKGVRQSNTTTGPFTESQTYGGDDPGELVMLANEVSKLSANSSGGRRGFSVSMIPSTSPFFVAS